MRTTKLTLRIALMTAIFLLIGATAAVATYYDTSCSVSDVCFYSEDGLTGLVAATSGYDLNHWNDYYPASGTTRIYHTVDSARNRGETGKDVNVYKNVDLLGGVVGCIPWGGATKDLVDDQNGSHYWVSSSTC